MQKLIQFDIFISIQFCSVCSVHQLNFILFDVFQNSVNIRIISGLPLFLHHGLRSTDIMYNSFQFDSTIWHKSHFGWVYRKFQFKCEKKTLGVPITSIMSVPTIIDEGINTHAHFKPSKKDFCYIKVYKDNIFNFIISGLTFFCHHGLRYANTKSYLLRFNLIFLKFELYQI